jgi:hypothetical protein
MGRDTCRLDPAMERYLRIRDALEMPRRRTYRALGAAAACALLAAGCGGSSSHSTTAERVTGTTATHAAASQQSAPTTTSDPGTRRQTAQEPAFGAALQNRMRTLWSAIVAESPSQGRQVFFPASAYLKMKTGVLPNPAGDFTWRLIAFFNLDLVAYHAHLGTTPAATKLIAVESDPSLATWIPPGACENTIGYWHLPGTRLVYEVDGRISSVRVASLISWRGVWYVVHLGPNPRPSNVGTVDDPEVGPGVPGPGGGC